MGLLRRLRVAEGLDDAAVAYPHEVDAAHRVHVDSGEHGVRVVAEPGAPADDRPLARDADGFGPEGRGRVGRELLRERQAASRPSYRVPSGAGAAILRRRA